MGRGRAPQCGLVPKAAVRFNQGEAAARSQDSRQGHVSAARWGCQSVKLSSTRAWGRGCACTSCARRCTCSRACTWGCAQCACSRARGHPWCSTWPRSNRACTAKERQGHRGKVSAGDEGQRGCCWVPLGVRPAHGWRCSGTRPPTHHQGLGHAALVLAVPHLAGLAHGLQQGRGGCAGVGRSVAHPWRQQGCCAAKAKAQEAREAAGWCDGRGQPAP